MGLDVVELVMDVEEKFGIEIPDDEASQIRTVGEFFDLVMTKISVSTTTTCINQRAFHLLRRHVIELLGISRRDFRLDTRLDELFPPSQRKQLWGQMRERSGATNWPSLHTSGVAISLFLLSLLSLPAVACWYIVAVTRMKFTLILFLPFFVALLATAPSILQRFTNGFGRSMQDVRALTAFVATQNPQLFGEERRVWTKDEAWTLFRSLVAQSAGTENFTRDSRIVEDLNLG